MDTKDSIKENYKHVGKQEFSPLADFFDNEESILCCASGMLTQAASCLALDYGEFQGFSTNSAYKTQQPKCFWHILRATTASFVINKNMENIHKLPHIPTSVLCSLPQVLTALCGLLYL